MSAHTPGPATVIAPSARRDGADRDIAAAPTPVFLSVVAPLFNEEANAALLVQRIMQAVAAIPGGFEIILVDDGSSDRTWQVMQQLAAQHPCVLGLRLSRNFGHQNALLAGLRHAQGQVVVSLDGDLQHPPEVIPHLVDAWRQGYRVVLTRRNDDGVASPMKRWTSAGFYRVFTALSGVEIHRGASDFRLLDRAPLEALLSFRDASLFLRGAVELLGFSRTIVAFDAAPRHAGTSKYTLRRMLRFANLALIGHSTIPLRIGIWIGVATAFLAFLQLVYVLVQSALGNTVPGWASSVGITALLFGVLFVLVGIIGAYVADIHTILKDRPAFIVADRTGSEPGPR
jgi:glycosyltransferase involved in cell wall biosynthesis